MRLPHIPKIPWDTVFKALEKVVVLYKLIEVFETMFSFFSDIKKAVADVKARITALEAKVEAIFTAAKAAVPVEGTTTTPTVEVQDATQEGNKPTTEVKA